MNWYKIAQIDQHLRLGTRLPPLDPSEKLSVDIIRDITNYIQGRPEFVRKFKDNSFQGNKNVNNINKVVNQFPQQHNHPLNTNDIMTLNNINDIKADSPIVRGLVIDIDMVSFPELKNELMIDKVYCQIGRVDSDDSARNTITTACGGRVP